MFRGERTAAELAGEIAGYLSDYELHLSHGRRIGVKELRERNVKIGYAHEMDEKLDKLLTRLWIAIDFTLNQTAAYKLFENHLGQGMFLQASAEERKA